MCQEIQQNRCFMPIDYSKYPPDWKDKIRPDILRRDHYKCKFCRIQHRAIGYRDKSGQFIECDNFMEMWAEKAGKRVFQVILTIAHLDQNIENNDYSNLAALCQKCHLNHDRPYNQVKRSAGKRKRCH